MWIKSLRQDAWVNITHITHFRIDHLDDSMNRTLHRVVAYLDAGAGGRESELHGITNDQAFEIVKHGTYEECEEFVKEQICLQTVYQWLGYIVAGGIGAVLTLIVQHFQNGSP